MTASKYPTNGFPSANEVRSEAGLSTIEVPIAPAIKQVEVRLSLSGLRMARWRLTIGALLVRLAAWVGGFTAVLEEDPGAVVVDETGIPSRMDIREPSHDWQLGMQLEVFIDGELLAGVIAYDMRAGWVERYRERAPGRLVVVGDELRIERLYGVVTVIWRDEVPA